MKWFTNHLVSVGQSYREHFARASVFGFCMILAGAACILHAILPFVFVNTASRTINKLNSELKKR